ncbi:MAG: Fic family protein [Rhodospirillales bacterium]|nr:Fic family protein [Rhodospirillales bacterium]
MDSAPKIASMNITPEILKRISELDEFKGAWGAIGRLAPERLSNLRRVATIESVGSSTRIEGVKLTDREVEALLLNLEIKEFKNRDEQEVAGYADVMETIFNSWDAIDLTENHIKQLHRDLLQYTDKDQRHRGAYKTLDNHVEAFGPDGESLGVIFETATPFETPAKMVDLVAWTKQTLEEKEHHPLIVISIFIVVFLAIHPFQDGNGRLSRILTTLLLLQSGYAYVPYSSLESVIEQSKEGYYLALRQTQGTIQTDTPDWQPWVTFFLKALQKQKQRLDAKIKREKIIIGDLPPLSVQILEIAREHGRVTVADAVKVTGTSRNTIKDHIKKLSANGQLEQHGKGRGVWYSLASV